MLFKSLLCFGIVISFLVIGCGPDEQISSGAIKQDAQIDHNIDMDASHILPRPGRASDEFIPRFYWYPVGAAGGWPGLFYKGGSQGALHRSRTGNPDR